MSEKPPRFSVGRVVATPNALHVLEVGGVSAASLLFRHVRGDWGEVGVEDARANEMALLHGSRLLSAYTVGHSIVWVITEADRCVTTLLLPSDY